MNEGLYLKKKMFFVIKIFRFLYFSGFSNFRIYDVTIDKHENTLFIVLLNAIEHQDET